MVLVHHHVFTIGQLGVIIPFGINLLGFVGAINRVYDGALGNCRLARFSVMNRFLREWFVAGDKDGLVNVRRRVASKVFHCALEDQPAIFLAATGALCEQFLGNFAEASGQRHDLLKPTRFAREPCITVLVKRHPHLRREHRLAAL